MKSCLNELTMLLLKLIEVDGCWVIPDITCENSVQMFCLSYKLFLLFFDMQLLMLRSVRKTGTIQETLNVYRKEKLSVKIVLSLQYTLFWKKSTLIFFFWANKKKILSFV